MAAEIEHFSQDSIYHILAYSLHYTQQILIRGEIYIYAYDWAALKHSSLRVSISNPWEAIAV